MKSIIKFIFALGLLVLPVQTNAAEYGAEPLMVIRFNQPGLRYQDQLYLAVSEAIKVKPSVIFEVVGYTPGGASANVRRVADDMAKIGVNPAQINISSQPAEVQNEEVRIFVR